jgi:hypothetical protein
MSADLAAKSKMAQAGNAAAAGEVRADLAILYNHFQQVKGIYDQLAGDAKAPGGGGLTELSLLVNDINRAISGITGLFGSSGITGVQEANTATLNGAMGPSDSLAAALKTLQGELGKYLNHIAQTYTSYIQADEHGSQILYGAAAGEPASSAGDSGKSMSWA